MSDHPSLKNSVALLGGFGKHRAELLSKEFSIESLYDLLFHFPIGMLTRVDFIRFQKYNQSIPMSL